MSTKTWDSNYTFVTFNIFSGNFFFFSYKENLKLRDFIRDQIQAVVGACFIWDVKCEIMGKYEDRGFELELADNRYSKINICVESADIWDLAITYH